MSRQISSDIGAAFPELKQALESIVQSLVSFKEIPAFKKIGKMATEALLYIEEATESALESLMEVSRKLQSEWDYILEKLAQLEIFIFEHLSYYVDMVKEWFEDSK